MKIKVNLATVDFEKNTLIFELPKDFWVDKRVFGGEQISIIDCPNIVEESEEIN